MKVKVKKVPVRYNGKTYKKDETFDMAEKYFNEAIVEKVASEKKQEDKGKTPGE